jgi:acetyl-CoA carboxylase carboxyl transferase subunit alpha
MNPTDNRIEELEEQIAKLKKLSTVEQIDLSEVIETLEKKRISFYEKMDGWEKTRIARNPERPKTLDYIEGIFDGFIELKGERLFSDDNALIGGPAWFSGMPVFVIGQEKGRTTEERITRYFGMPNPEGYRKSLRLMKLAEKFGKPVITFIDTPGAYPGIGAEERGQAIAIAENIMAMSQLKVPTIAIIIGEGGSGGALALGVCDRVFMMEYSVYSVISPAGCASILFRDATKAPQAANSLRLTATDLKNLDIIDDIIPEPLGGSHQDPVAAITACREIIYSTLETLATTPLDQLLTERYEKFRRMGKFQEIPTPKTTKSKQAKKRM